MDFITGVLLSIEGLFFLFMMLTLIYLIFRRIKIKENENFDERDN